MMGSSHSGLPLSAVLAYHARGTTIDAAREVPDQAPLPTAKAESAQATERVHKAVNGLRPKRREVLLLRLSCDEPNVAAIAERLGITRQAAHVRHAAALEDLEPALRALL